MAVELPFRFWRAYIAMLAVSLTLLAATSAHAASDITIPGSDAFPEGMTSMQDGTLIIGSMGQGTIFRVLPGQTDWTASLSARMETSTWTRSRAANSSVWR